jgi:photosystem II stability/assembly factor-like uncharacterized protein
MRTTLERLAAGSLFLLATPAWPAAGAPEAEALARLEWRSIGPANMGGRVTAVEGVPGDPKVFWVAGADGGVWKTANAGVTFEGQFQDQPVYSVGALALAPSDHNVLWLGSGEGDPRNSASYGNGVYRSTDGGRSWNQLGLDRTERIKRIAVHPTDPDTAWVCALGREWGPNPERGVFRTRDGGASWEKVLFLDPDTGCSDVALDPSNPRVLYTGMWTFRRKPWRLDSGGGRTALYRSTDGGATWEKKTEGLPKGAMDRIGLAVAASRPSTVYLVTEAVDEGTLFRSDDRGESWRRVNDDARIDFRPFYYSDIRVDPTNPEVVYSLSGRLFKSIDGGRSFEQIARGVHGDHQAFWIDPLDPDRLLSGSDGGFQVSHDGGATWDVINNVVLAQFYHVALDDREPYRVCGGLQDNGGWCGPSRTTNTDGILDDDWFTVSGGDGFYAVPVPGTDLVVSNLQGGPIFVTDTRSGDTRHVHPSPNRIGSAGDAIADHEYRFNWDAPILVSPHDPRTLYYGGNVVFRSADYGYTWEVISPDLTTDDPDKQRSSGGPVVVDNTAAEFHCTIFTLAESPVEKGLIWAGTDDGNIQLTRDGGGHWTNVKGAVRGLPAFAWIASIDASRHRPGTAYVAVDHHRSDDFRPYVFRTDDYGATWTPLAAGLPQDDYVKVVREDPRNPDLLYAGMERGLDASWDAGRTWVSIRNNLPPVSVRDIQVHPRDGDLVIGTHGRGAWILDDPTPLRGLREAMSTGVYLFPPRAAVRWQLSSPDADLGQRTWRAANPPEGALISYWLEKAPDGPVTVAIADAAGEEVYRITEKEPKPGVTRVAWDLRYEGAERPKSDPPDAGRAYGQRSRVAPPAVPGRYTVTLKAGGEERSAPLEVRGDPRIDASLDDLRAQRDAALDLRGLARRAYALVDRSDDLRKQLEGLKATLGGSKVDGAEDAAKAAGGVLEEVARFHDEVLQRPKRGLNYRQYPRLREEIESLTFQVTQSTARPTAAQVERLGELRGEVAGAESRLDAILGDVKELNQRLEAFPRILLPPAAGEGAGDPGG